MRTDQYRVSYYAAVAVAVLLTGLAATQMAADTLELSRQQAAILGIASAMLGVLASFLPRVNKPPADNRIGKD